MHATEKLAREGTAKRAEQDSRREAIAKLQSILTPGSVVYTVLRHVSTSGMRRCIDLYVMEGSEPVKVTHWAARAIGDKVDQRHGGIIVCGCGMDVGAHLVYALSHRLYPDGHGCTGEGCPSNDHSNGDRDYTPHRHTDGGYALSHRWL